ncbi:sensor histidine kinase [Zafaria sp. Z1313]|uniref:sensor histidine kinase n=1 Tax=Zafaria sp. Z1313 TaxID=3423202 RepID=UPI003D302BDE
MNTAPPPGPRPRNVPPDPGTGVVPAEPAPATPSRRRLSLSSRMLAAVIALLALVCLVIGLITHAAMASTLYGQLDEQLTHASSRAAAFNGAGGPGLSDPLNAPGQASGTLNFRLVGNTLEVGGVLDPETGERRDLSGFTQEDAQSIAAVAPGEPPVDVALSFGDYRLMAVRPDGGAGTLITGLPLTAAHDTLTSLSWTMLLVSAAGVLATGLAGTLIIRRSLRPLERVSAVAASVAALPLDAGNVRLAQRVAPDDAVPGTEAGNVGHALNALLDNVESALEVRQASEENMRRFVADASHELRTPLAAVRGYSELVSATEHLSDDGRRSLDRVVEQSRRMGSLVENLLLLARLDEGTEAQRSDVDLTLLVAETVSDFRVTSPGHRWRLELPSEPVLVHGDQGQLGRVLNNLLSNARKHTADGTEVTATLARSGDGGSAVLRIADDGAGIEPGFLPRVFERFARADRARSGNDGTTGLGLPIVKAIVEAHGGSIGVASRPGLTEFTVRLPLAANPGRIVPPRPTGPPSVRSTG